MSVSATHAHLLEPGKHSLLCACEACAILFGTRNSQYRRVPRRIRLMRDFVLTENLWEEMAIPINVAYLHHDSAAHTVRASYPSPAGATASLLSMEAWDLLVESNPILDSMEPDVEGLLMNRLGAPSGSATSEYFILPIDECYKLVGLIRAHWRGLSGGTEVWREVAEYFDGLRQRALIVEGGRA